MSYQQGDIVIVPFPFTDLSDNKVRPALVVSNNFINSSQDVILVQITTQPQTGPYALKINNGDVSTPFKHPHTEQYIVCKKIAVIEKSIIRRKITVLDSVKLNEVIQKVKTLFDN
ncbi:type II toxin-antitoxin system PemK/MazF family toxin [Splendidivirga corallicola]|uniref:type II toxin-antitoxin system PemK/MazF family toxin n=1 Tax=Splendidivirga corallicola TaxID=3051826 RepID=UPI003D265DFE